MTSTPANAAINVSIAEASRLVQEALRGSRFSHANAEIAAEVFVASEAMGIESHGLSRVPGYAAHAMSGKLDGSAEPSIDVVSGSMIRVDARHGLAFTAIRRGLDAAIDAVLESGIVVVAVHRSHHGGAMGLHLERVAARGLVGLAFANAPSAMAMAGGRRPLLGTNPMALAAPRRDRDPIVIDAAMSRVARGNLLLAAQAGEQIPLDWGVDSTGEPTRDPNAVMKGGMLLPVGGDKGAALALLVEILAAAVTGSALGFTATAYDEPNGPPPSIGQLLVVIDPGRTSGGGYVDAIESLAARIEGEKGTRLPGARRFERRRHAELHGLDVPARLIDQIEKLGKRNSTA